MVGLIGTFCIARNGRLTPFIQTHRTEMPRQTHQTRRVPELSHRILPERTGLRARPSEIRAPDGDGRQQDVEAAGRGYLLSGEQKRSEVTICFHQKPTYIPFSVVRTKRPFRKPMPAAFTRDPIPTSDDAGHHCPAHPHIHFKQLFYVWCWWKCYSDLRESVAMRGRGALEDTKNCRLI